MMRRAASLEEDRIDRVRNPTRKRLARILLILAGLDCEDVPVLECISDAMLAELLGANPSCIQKLLHEFRGAGYLRAGDALSVRSSLVQVLVPPRLADIWPMDGLAPRS